MKFVRSTPRALFTTTFLALTAMSADAVAQGTPPKDPVSTQAISVPKGEGSIEGMGESFSAQPSTGIATFRVPVQVPKARGGAQASLSIEYSSAGGAGPLGLGWNLAVPFISRQTDRGNPKYNDAANGAFSADQDRFVFGGGQELVPLGVVVGGRCAAAPGESMPSWAEGWQYFRARVEGAFLRFFWSPDRRTWRVFDKSGTSMELGVPLDGSGSTNALETSPTDIKKIFRWNLARAYDNEGPTAPLSQATPAPVNVVVYKYTQLDGITYLSDTYDTPPAESQSAPLSKYAHHTHLVYEPRTDPTFSFRRGWQTQMTQRLVRVDVSSQPFSGIGTRELLRRYVLSYTPNQRTSLLASVIREGRCSSPVQEDAGGQLPYAQACPALPPMRFGYTQGGRPGSSTTQFQDLGTFDKTVVPLGGSPSIWLSDDQTDFVDVNADALPDIFRTVDSPSTYAVWFNSPGGTATSFGALNPMSVQSPGNLSMFLLNQATTAPLDLDGNSIVDLLFVPNQATGYVASPTRAGNTWQWAVRAMTTPSDGNTLLNMSSDSPNVRVMDVNGDGLIDIVRSTTEMQTFLNLGRYPGGDGRFGTATRTSPTSSDLVKAPVRTCLPGDNGRIQLNQSDIFVADMNGDGLVDFVRMGSGKVEYWPGHGDGWWGVVPPPGCPGTTRPPGARGEVRMSAAPVFSSGSGAQRLVDLNGDALDDLVDVQGSKATVYFNLGGLGFASGFVITSTPEVTDSKILRFVDVDGSGNPDIVWGRGGSYRYLNVLGGTTPNLLARIENGLGQTTDIAYESSTSMMLTAERAGKPWSSQMPIVTHVVAKVVTSDNVSVGGRAANTLVTEYTYREPAWDGAQREFRGFRKRIARVAGDANSPASTMSVTFLTGDCEDESIGDSVNDCSIAERWRDNRREALKGLSLASETFDDNGVYLSTSHTSYTLRHLYTGLDGRAVRHSFASGSDTWSYDTYGFTASASPLTADDVSLEGGAAGAVPTSALTLRSSKGRVRLQTSRIVDSVGNVTSETSRGCVEGCGGADEAITTRKDFSIAPGDASGWLYRPTHTWIEGSQTPRRKEQYLEYDDRGHVRVTRAALSGTLALNRFHEDPTKSVAPVPLEASGDGLIVVSTQKYDTFGNATYQTAANYHCQRLTLETDFAQFAIAETVYVGKPSGECGETALTAYAAYDRGFGAPVNVIDLHGELSTVTYDGLGRVTSMRRPSPAQIGATSPIDSVKVEYFLPDDARTTPYSLIHTQAQDGDSDATQNYRDSWAFIDGLGRTIVTLNEADPSAGDGGQWLVSHQTERNAKGAAQRIYEPRFWSGNPNTFPLRDAPSTKFTQEVYDSFDRVLRSYALDGTVSQRDYHALTVDEWDAEDLGTGSHAGTYSSVRKDGHGRVVSSIERVRAAHGLELLETQTSYLTSGEVAEIRRLNGAALPVTRRMQYDSLGRMVLNVEPDSSKEANGVVKAWRYAYDNSGNLVGTSDARGCGTNSYYDAGGRLLAEDYSPCLTTHADYSPPNLATGDGTEAFYHYDTPDPDAATTIDDCTIRSELLAGRLASTSDRGAKTVTGFDGRGRIACVARRVARPGAPTRTLSDRYAPRWYTQLAGYDAADRRTRATTGAKLPELMGEAGTSVVTTGYSARGLVTTVGGSYGALVSSTVYDADGASLQIRYGDAAETKTDFTYNARRRVQSVQTYRGPPQIWSQSPPGYSPAPDSNGLATTFQLLLEDADFTYDQVDNPTKIQDYRIASDWPDGAKPVTRTMKYDDLYRLTQLDYQYEGGGDAWVSPFASEDAGDHDARRGKPQPRLSFSKRLLSQTFQYDWLGNTSTSNDDAGGFYDRALGAITNGTPTSGPYQLKSATGGISPRNGMLTVQYDDAGNMVGLSVERSASAPCLPFGSSCSQRFAYDWDEAGRLVHARRWDGANLGAASGPLPVAAPSVELRYVYDADDERVLKVASTAQGDSHSVYIFDSLELRGSKWDGSDYERTAWTEVPYLFAHEVRIARLHYADMSVPTATSGQLHVLLELRDNIGSSHIVVDKGSGELVERMTYTAYGGVESDYRPDRWNGFREDYRFTGKEEDVEIGLSYFGKRYLSSSLNRWVSPDPLAVHSPGQADINVYAYVHGRTMVAVDPTGLLDTSTPLAESMLRMSSAMSGRSAVPIGSPHSYQGALSLAGFGSEFLSTKLLGNPYFNQPSEHRQIREWGESHGLWDHRAVAAKPGVRFLGPYQPQFMTARDRAIAASPAGAFGLGSGAAPGNTSSNSGKRYISLFHGTNSSGEASIRGNGVDVKIGNRRQDFGAGFYTTASRTQARDWAEKRFSGDARVVEFKVAEEDLKGLTGVSFTGKTEAWEGMVRGCRTRGCGPGTQPDFIEGPMLLNPQMFADGAPAVAGGHQVSFHTEAAAEVLDRSIVPRK